VFIGGCSLGLKTKAEYIESLKKQKPVIYMYGEKIEDRVDHPLIKPEVEVGGLTYEIAHNPKYRDLATAKSHLTGEVINRFNHIHQNTDDLMKKVRLTRLLARYCICLQRCMGWDALNTLSIITYEIDRKYKTNYYERFVNYLKYVQKEDLFLTCAMTDVKGDRSLRPADQQDKDMYVHIVEKRENGIVVRGAKAHTTAALISHEIVVMPTRAMREKDKDYAVAFAIPVDTPGLKFIARSTVPREMRELDAPFRTKWGVTETLTIFDDVFVPWERVFMCGEWEFAGLAAELFASYHRFSYCGCKAGAGDVLMGTAALLAEYNGVEHADHIQSKLTDMACTAEIIYACGLAAAVRGRPMGPGTYVPDVTYSNIGKYVSGTHIYEEFLRVHDIGGGIICTCPSERDYLNPETKPYIEKYLKGKVGIPTEHRIRAIKLAEDLTVHGFAGWIMVASCHGGGSPEAQKLTIYRTYDWQRRKQIAKVLARIEPWERFPEFEL
jgi:aromatic ring hydroxylase